MNFIGSARKWRPQRFEDLVGQEHIRRTFSNALEAGRIASAYLFSGTRGVGKTTTARILAKSLNCESSDNPVAEPCNKCSSCEEISQGSHPDVLEIDGATYTGVDHVRELREGLRYRPARGRYKTLIIDEVHMLSKGAFNALLKTLEEPPPHVVFIFATTELQRVPDTILSRCQVFEFRRIATNVIAEQLSRIVKEQNLEVEEDALVLLARMGEGSMRDAQSLLDQVIAFSGNGVLTASEVEGVLGVPSSEVYRNIVTAMIERDAHAALLELNNLFDAGHDLRLFCGNLLEFLRDIMVFQSAGEDDTLFNLGPSEIGQRKALAGRLSFPEAHQAYSILQSGEIELRASTHPRMTLELALLRMCRLRNIAELGPMIEKLESKQPITPSLGVPSRAGAASSDFRSTASMKEEKGDKDVADKGASPPVASAVQVSWDIEEAGRIWAEAVRSLRPAQRELLKGVDADLRSGGTIKLSLPVDNGHAQAFEMIQQAVPSIEAFFGSEAPWPVRVILEKLSVSEPSPPEDSVDVGERQKIKETEETFIQEVIDIFDGQISNIRPARNRGGKTNGDR
ncbi:MAG: DNA polymerase III subunit gamma/tau [Nitrospinaceae bacterium]|jgi:DNA polymerase III subunit gamma/tau|nr:DNA polymerase III subunit gamma/tau [Nitrospinaceae bacterium]MBT3434250.1 DNA polymerase III subunit gamma/tau [Nitrospinaceae bacterium]MBT3819955.1 DNA polymerase III subunit gamma/tau [Nitrospinaceae bacterium]MBT4093710.1 DNA polymerase III subunit gamma/tau [Nitrospinaceae bacterium]MBT4430519.1 DNA polymerase III subunit gamma/tau [Nitrospinaceae bacterium]